MDADSANSPSPIDVSPKLSDLPLEVILCLSPNHVNWARLIEFSSAQKENFDAAEIVFRQRFLQEKFEIIGTQYSKNSNDFDILLKVLQLFGHLIAQLKLDYQSLNSYQCETINQHLNAYCSGSLEEIQFVHVSDRALSELRGPFERVTFVRIDLEIVQRDTMVRYDVMFPALKRFEQDGLNGGGPVAERLNYHFEHLESVVYEAELHQKKFWPNLEKRLTINKELRHITFTLANWNHLKIVSENGTQIKSVTFKRFINNPVYEENIQLNAVKIFKFLQDDIGSRSNKIPLVFGNLEEIVCNNPADKWFDIIIQNKQLKKVRTGKLKEEHLNRIADELPNLEEFITDFNISNNTDKIVTFIGKGARLKRVQFTQLKFDTSKKAVKLLGSAWKLGAVDVFVKQS